MRELEEREKRRKNVIMYNIPESDAEEPETRVQEDKYKAIEIADILNTEIDPSKTVRLGVRSEENNRPRPLRLSIQDTKTRDTLLSNAKDLRKSNNETAKNVFIKMDQTRMQRAEEKKLLEQRNELREEAKSAGDNSHIWIIRKVKVIKVKNT